MRTGLGLFVMTWLSEALESQGAKGDPLGKHSGAITQGWQARWQGDEAETKLYLFILI